MSLNNIKKYSTIDASYADSQEAQTSDEETKPETPTETKNETDNNIKTDEKPDAQNVKESKTDQDLYNEILEKLDIKEKGTKQTIQEKSMREKPEAQLDQNQEAEKLQLKAQIEKTIAGDFAKIQKLLQTGLIDSVQGQNLKKQVLKKAFDMLVQTEKTRMNLSPASNPNFQNNNAEGGLTDKNEVFEEFSKSNPNFFTPEGRKEVLDYLKSGDVILGKDELNKISSIIRTVEKSAIDRYLKKVDHEKTLRTSNEVAKQRLTANAQKSGSGGNLLRSFTREQIGKMSSAEFIKYEPAIMEQLKKGLIR